MEIIEGMKIVDKTLYHAESRTLFLSDIHLGLEESLRKEGVLIVDSQLESIKNSLREVMDEVDVQRVVINGDLKHEFGSINKQEWSSTLSLLDFIVEEAEELVLIEGNHDVLLSYVSGKRNVELRDYYSFTDSFNGSERVFLTIHGDEVPEEPGSDSSEEGLSDGERLYNVYERSGVLIIGHEHPAVSIDDGIRSEKYKTFLKGEFQGRTIIVLPSFNPLIEGSDVLRERTLSPFLSDIDNFSAFIVSDSPYSFGKLKKLKDIDS